MTTGSAARSASASSSTWRSPSRPRSTPERRVLVMSNVSVANLAYAHPGGDLLFSEVSFRIAPGRHVGLVGANGVGKTTADADPRRPARARGGRGPRRRARRLHGPGRRCRRGRAHGARAAALARRRPACDARARRCSVTRRSSPPATRRPGWSWARRSPTGRRWAATSSKATGTPRAGGSSAPPSTSWPRVPR